MSEAATERDLAAGLSPRELVPGDGDGLRLTADTLRSWARVLGAGGDALARVEVTSWRGEASRGFVDTLSPQPGRWRAASDGFTAGATALEAYAACLTPAREIAASAVAAYQRYLETLAASAVLSATPSPVGAGPRVGALGAAATAIAGRAAQMQAIAAGGVVGGPTTFGAVGHDLVYAADALRRQAIQLLETARASVRSSAALAVDALHRAVAAAPAAQGFTETTIRPAPAEAAGHTTLDALGMIPGLGEIADGLNASWYLAEQQYADAAISGTGMLPILGSAAVGGRMLRNSLRVGDEVAEEVELARLVPGEGGGTRHVNFKPSATDPKWGLTPDHVRKHLLGTGSTSLRSIDPAGNPGMWWNYLQDLASRPATSTMPDGVQDILGTFPKSDGSGTFRLGLRVMPNADGTFDLITVLTKQVP